MTTEPEKRIKRNNPDGTVRYVREGQVNKPKENV